MKLLALRGVLIEEQRQTHLADNDSDSDDCPHAGQTVLALQGAMPRETGFKQNLRKDMDGFSLHAAVRCDADERRALDQLCRFITRPPRPNSGCNATPQDRVR